MMKVINIETEIGKRKNKKNYHDFELGMLVGLYREAKLFDVIQDITGQEMRFGRKVPLDELNKIRIDCVHTKGYVPSLIEVKNFYNHVETIIDEMKDFLGVESVEKLTEKIDKVKIEESLKDKTSKYPNSECDTKEDEEEKSKREAVEEERIQSKNMIAVEGGTFRMGSNENSDEKPIHGVTLDSFYIGKYEVTQEEWKEIMGNNPSYFKRDNLPVENVSWYDAVEYCNKRSEKEGLEKVYSYTKNGDNNLSNVKMNKSANGYRLLTEAEWEYAARGGNKSNGYKYSGSNNIDEVAEYRENNGKSTKPVGGKKANELGIF